MKTLKILIALPILLLAACSGWQPSPVVKKDGVVMVMPNGNGMYYIRNEQDYQNAMYSCIRLRNYRKYGGNDFCVNELKWQREYGALRFLGEEKPKMLFHQ